MKRSVAFVAGLLCLSLVAHAGPIMVLFDEAHDELNTISWERALEVNPDHPEFQYFGKLNELPASEFRVERSLEILDASRLQGFDVVVIASPMATFSEEEINALGDFVDHGGGLLVVQDTWPDPLGGGNQLAESFGLRYRAGALCSEHSDWDVSSFRVSIPRSSHSIIQGIDEFQMNWGSSIEATSEDDVLLQTDEYAWQDVNGNRRRDPDEPQGPLIVAVARQVNEGRIVFIADNAFHDNIWYANGQLFRNALEWLSIPVQHTVALDIPSFDIDPDVTLDSVVQVGEGPQELSTEIKFYPNTRRIKPGETVYWTLDLGDLVGPFSIIPEMDNDGYREETIRTSESMVVIAHTYETANIYVPYLLVYYGEGSQTEVHSRSVLGVIPDIAVRNGLGIDLPGSDGSPGDYLEGMHVYAFDYKLFGTPAGEEFIQEELDRVASLGVNLMIYNIEWVFEEATDSLHEPVYGDAGWRDACCGWVSTFSIDALIKLSDWSHERGMRVAIRYFLARKCYSSVGRETFDPASIELYMEQQTAIKLLYAELCQKLGIEIFFLDAENDVFTREPRVSNLIQSIRQVYDGLLTGGACSVDRLYGCPFADELDFVAWSDYFFFYNLAVPDKPTTEQLVNAYLFHYVSDIKPVLESIGKPGMVLETGANIRENEQAVVEAEYTAYLDAFARLQEAEAPLIGNGWWVWNLSDPPVEPNVMRGHSAEMILAHYFTHVLSDTCSVRLSGSAISQPQAALVLEDFENGLPRYLLSAQGSSLEPSIVERSPLEGDCLRLHLEPTSEPDYRYGFILEEYTRAANWSGYDSFNFWLKAANENWGLEITLYDADGDRFNVRIDTKPFLSDVLPESQGWRLVSLPLELFAKPSWDTAGDGSMDWTHVGDWGFGLLYYDQGPQTIWIDNVYLSRQGSLDFWLTPSADGVDSAAKGENQAIDSDGDGVPNDEDYCPDWPGSPDKNGC